jgi:hypothetical protein
VLDRARVIDLAYADDARPSVGSAGTSRGVVALLLALRPDEARALIEAARTSEIDVARLPDTATPIAGSAPTTP